MNSNSKVKYFNLNEFELSDGDKKKELIIDLDNVCKDTGFLLITGHNIDRKILDNIWSVVDLFFEQSIEFNLL